MHETLELIRKNYARLPPTESGPKAWNLWIEKTFSDIDIFILAGDIHSQGATATMDAVHKELARLDYLRTTGGGTSFSMSRSDSKPPSLLSGIGSLLRKAVDPQPTNSNNQ